MAGTIADAIRAWFVKEMHDSPVSRNTECFNHVRAATDRLAESDWAQGPVPGAKAAEKAAEDDPLGR